VLLQLTIFKAALVIGASYFYVLLLMWMCRCVDSQVKNASCPLAIREFSDGDVAMMMRMTFQKKSPGH